MRLRQRETSAPRFFFLSFFSMPAVPFFSSYFPSCNSGPKGEKKKKKKTESGEDEDENFFFLKRRRFLEGIF
jgi:hypothetical protein